MILREVFGPVLAILVLILVWIFRDARARDTNPVLWVAGLALGGLFGFWWIIPVGFIVYLVARPKGKLERCPNCGSGYLYWLAECPKCESPLKKECRHCNEAIPIMATECPQCGGRI